LLPPFLFQFPRSFSSFFSPIGFLWCSHASYRITLDFLLPRSVILFAPPASICAEGDNVANHPKEREDAGPAQASSEEVQAETELGQTFDWL
jgi:hypothetical protein